MRRKKVSPDGKVNSPLNLHSMIDVVFMLLIFFVLTMNFAEAEGDFHLNLPLGTVCPENDDLPLYLSLESDADGNLQAMSLGSQVLGTDFDRLRNLVLVRLQSRSADMDQALVIDSARNLRYRYLIDAITAVSGYRDGHETIGLVENIRFKTH